MHGVPRHARREENTMSEQKRDREFPIDVKDSAHKVWLAGLGAVAVAEEKGAQFFKHLVERGETDEERRKEQVEKVVDRVKDGVEDVREGVETRWQQLGDSLDRKVAQAVERLGVPTRDEIHELTRRVEDLTSELDKLQSRKTGSTRARKSAAKKRTAKKGTAKKTA
jgi:poly(hydroxyalkanoate) granule-associated protein